MIALEKPTRSRADLLLRYLTARRIGSAAQFRDAVEYCFGDSEHYVRVARRLCALGYVEFDWNGPELRWRVAPPSFYRLKSRLGLCGCLSRDDEGRISAEGIPIDEERAEFGADTITQRFVRDTDGSIARRLARAPLGFAVADEAYYDLLQRLPPLRNLLMRQVPAVLPDVAVRFNHVTRRFDTEISEPVAADGLLKEIGYGKSVYYYEGRRIDLTTALWLVMSVDATHNAEYAHGTLTLPAFPELPPLFERVLHLAGASRETLELGRVGYHNVERGVASVLVAKLGMRHSNGLTTR